MAKYTHEFCVEREINGEDVELTLQVEMDVEPFVQGRFSGPPEDCFPDEGGFAQIDGLISVQNADGKFEPWEGTLTGEEVAKVEADAYEAWEQNEAESEADFEDDDLLLSPEYDDYFHDERAIHTAGGGKVFF